jgi:hypothetical protein
MPTSESQRRRQIYDSGAVLRLDGSIRAAAEPSRLQLRHTALRFAAGNPAAAAHDRRRRPGRHGKAAKQRASISPFS